MNRIKLAERRLCTSHWEWQHVRKENEMAEDKVIMDTGIFTNIVSEISAKASDCVLMEDPLGATEVFEDTDVGNRLTGILDLAYKATETYQKEASVSVPAAFLKLRDSMINVDNAAATSLKVEK